MKDGRSRKFSIAEIASTFTAEALAIGETLEIIEKIHSEQNFMFFSDSAGFLKIISNSSTMNNTLHITQMLKDKIERLESRGKIQFYWIKGHCRVEVNERKDSEAKQSIKEGRDSKLLLPMADLKTQWRKNGKEELHSFCQNTKRDRGERYFERYYRKRSPPLFSKIILKRCAFVSINRMRAGHSSLKASLNSFNILFTTECEYGDGLQTKEHIFWDCKRHEDQRAILMDILSENSKKEYPKSVTELLRLEGNIYVQGVCYFMNIIPKFI
jgi:ribonuclease HI